MCMSDDVNILSVLQKGICCGCGMCAAICPSNRIEMRFSSKDGFYVPHISMECPEKCGMCLKVCPFGGDNQSTLDVTAGIFGLVPGIKNDAVMGHYLETYVGYSDEHRKKSASGGLATWFLEALLSKNLIDGTICVGHDPASATLFSYKVNHSIEEVRECSGSCYQPVEISRVIRHILKHDGRYAVTALPCVARGLRLAMSLDPRLNKRIHCIVGLVCGGMKKSHYIEYVLRKWIRTNERPKKLAMRYKKAGADPTDVTFAFWMPGKEDPELVSFSDGIGRSFCDGSFNLDACSYCDDVFAECADVTFMDAWLDEYSGLFGGYSLALIRTPEAYAMFERDLTNDILQISKIEPQKVLESQTRVGVVANKRILNGCNYNTANKKNVNVSRIRSLKPRWDQWVESSIKRSLMKQSKYYWIKCDGDHELFDSKMLFLRLFYAVFRRVRNIYLKMAGRAR